MRVVLDTNVWVSGLILPNSGAGRIIKEWRYARFQIIISSYILEEIGKVLSYPKIKKRLQWDQVRIQQYIDILTFFTETIDDIDVDVHVESDPQDSPILWALINSEADYLISGDKHLLNLKAEYPIITVADFLSILDE